MAAEVYLARETSSLRIYHIDEVDKEAGYKYKCFGCGKDLTPVKSGPRLRDWHYRHAVRSICAGAKDKALHDFAVQILLENTVTAIAKDLNIEYTDPRKELVFFNYRSDVAVKLESEDVHFEIYVTHDVSRDKAQCYKQNKLKSVKIDLSAKSLRKESSERIRHEVLSNCENRTVIFWKEEVEPSKMNNRESDDGFFIVLGTLFAFLGVRAVIKWLKKNNRS